MYKEKLLSQLEVFEDLQRKCYIDNIYEAVELKKQILSIAKKIDKIDKGADVTINTTKGIKDELYPCKPDIFENSYEKAI